ncbi:MAG: hypothetical protein Q4P65_02835 [Eubacteriales bacterium]|nr:hypothetical protein [Eubacteriales bacterium]
MNLELLSKYDRQGQACVAKIYNEARIDCDPLIEELYVLRDGSEIKAVAGLSGRSIRSLAVASAYQEKGLAAELVGKLQQLLLREPGEISITGKAELAAKLAPLGFTEVAKTEKGTPTSFLIYPGDSFAGFLAELKSRIGAVLDLGAIVMNLNPLTLGHLYLIDEALKECSNVVVFLLSEESAIPYCKRREILLKIADKRPGLIVQETGPYLVSRATFPAYFYPDSESRARAQASLDAAVFEQIARAVGIRYRYLGTEPYSRVTAIYNEVISAAAKFYEVRIIERLSDRQGLAISASRVRDVLNSKELSNWEKRTILQEFLPSESLEVLFPSK